MASILNVDQINNAAGTSAVTIDASTGKPSFPNGAVLPAGSVVQVQRYQDASAGSATSTSTSYVDDGVSISITPNFSNSILFVTCTSGSSIAGGYGHFRILESVSGTVVQEIPFGNFSGSPQWLLGFTLDGWYTPSNTTQRTFKLQGQTTAGTRYVNYAVRPTISVMEIAQ